MATARISATGLPIPQGGISDILEGGRYIGPPRVFAGGAGGSGSNILKGILNLITNEGVMTGEDLANIPVEEREAKKKEREERLKKVKGSRAAGMTAEEQKAAAERGDFGPLEMSKKDDDIIEVKDEDLIREERKDVTTGGQDPDKDPDEETIIFDDAQTTARKLTQQGIGELIDKSIKKLKEKYKELGKEKEFELYEEDPSNLDKSLKSDIAKQIYEDNKDKPLTSKTEGVVSIIDLISNSIGVKNKKTFKNLLSNEGAIGSINYEPTSAQGEFGRKSTLSKYENYVPTIIEIYKNNLDLPLSSRDPNKKTITKLVQEAIGPVTKSGGQIDRGTIAKVLEGANLKEKIISETPLETKEKIINYLIKDDNYKTMSSTQVIKNLNLDMAENTLSELRRKGFPGVTTVEGYDNQKLSRPPSKKTASALSSARTSFDNKIKSDFPNMSREEQNRLKVTFSDYISDAFDITAQKGYTKNQIEEAYNYTIQERLFPNLEEEAYQNFFAELRSENEKTFDVINQIRQFEGQKPLAGFKEFIEKYPDLFLTMGHTGRSDPKQGQGGGFDLRNVEPQTLSENLEANNYYKELLKAWGNDEDPDDLDLFVSIANEMINKNIRQVFEIPKSGQTIIIGRQEPKPFPSEQQIFDFGQKKEIDFKRDGGIVGMNYMTRPLP